GLAPLKLENGRLTLELLVDRASIETYANGGRVSLTSCFVPKLASRKIELFTRGGSATIISLDVHDLRSAWTPRRGE
ncbi:MAG: GH32 C-terminal domain-containing protein, partial [Chthoniobacterales bacterium]|nr:GH32 C-terminal domain-containing protein [Chthoniobacterales bacterium]